MTATPAHLGRTTHVWDAVVTDDRETPRTLALFRCTQLARLRSALRTAWPPGASGDRSVDRSATRPRSVLVAGLVLLLAGGVALVPLVAVVGASTSVVALLIVVRRSVRPGPCAHRP